MGSINTKNANILSDLTIDEVKRLINTWKTGLKSAFGLTDLQCNELITKSNITLPSCGTVKKTCSFFWKSFNPEKKKNIGALEVLSGSIIFCQGDFNDKEQEMDVKLDMIFKLFDFNGDNNIDQSEMALLFSTIILGLSRFLTQRNGGASEQACEKMGAQFKEGANVTCDQFKQIMKMHIAREYNICSMEEILNLFDVSIENFVDDEGAVEKKNQAEELELPPDENIASEGIVTDFLIEEDEEGDQFMAIKPWLGAIVAPTNPPAIKEGSPDADLRLEWIHGYRCFDTRNNVFFIKTGELVYHTAAVGIVYNYKEHKQRYFMKHTDDINALAVNKAGDLIATAQIGVKPTIRVWDPVTMKELACLSHSSMTRGINHLSFSPNGTLVGVALDDNHSIGVWPNPVSSPKGVVGMIGKEKILGISTTDTQIAAVGENLVNFLDIKTLKSRKGVFGKVAKRQNIVSCAYVKGNFYTGGEDGEVCKWIDGAAKQVVKAHKSTVNCCYSSGEQLITGSRDGIIKTWDANLKEIAINTIPQSKQLAVRAYARNPTNPKQEVIGCSNADIYVVENGKETLVHEGHSFGEAWGLAMSPDKLTFATSGDEGDVKIWNTKDQKCIKTYKIGGYARSLAYSSDGKMLAVGTGGRLGGVVSPICGEIIILNPVDMSVISKFANGTTEITDMKFAPGNKLLAIGATDGYITFYDVPSFKKKSTKRIHSSYITHLDFTADGKYLQSNCGAYELLFTDTATGKQVTNGASKLKDTDWATWNCVLGWPVQGIWPKFADGTDINAVDRSNDKKLLATADDFGHVKLFNFPVLTPGSKFVEFAGHSSHVTNVMFSADDKYVVSIGGNDKAVFQWKLAKVDDSMFQFECDGEDSGDQSLPPTAEELELMNAPEAQKEKKFGEKSPTAEGDFALDSEGTGDEFMAIKPWLGAIVAPSSPPKQRMSDPDGDFELEWIYGYQTELLRNNLAFAADGSVAYTCAAVGIVYGMNHSQKFFQGYHTDDITSFAISDDRTLIATGERGKKPMIFVWNVQTMSLVQKLAGHRNGVASLAFSHDKTRIASVGADPDHTLIVYNIANGAVNYKLKGDTNEILEVKFHPNDKTIVTVGEKHIYYWDNGVGTMKSSRGILGSKGSLQTFYSIGFNKAGNLIVGTATGSLYCFNENKQLTKIVNTPQQSVYCIYSNNLDFITGGRNGTAIKWDIKSGSPADPQIVLKKESAIRSVDFFKNQTLVGTQRCEAIIAESEKLLFDGHYYGELWGCAVHPTKPIVATTGDDKQIRLWDSNTHKLIKKTTIEGLSRGASFSPDGNHLAVVTGGRLGGKEPGLQGDFIILDSNTLNVVTKGNAGKSWIQEVKYSPDGKLLAIGSHDSTIYVFDVAGNYKLKFKMDKHSSYITHIDFTKDGTHLQSNCGAYELLFTDTATGKQVTNGASKLKDTEWASWTCVLGWPVQGIWPKFADGTDINSVDRSNNGQMLAIAGDDGKVKIFNYPVIQNGASYDECVGHSSHVTNVKWARDDSLVYSVGGNDRGLFQWKFTGIGADRSGTGIQYDEDLLEEIEIVERDEKFSNRMEGFCIDIDTTGDEFMAVKPWIGAIKAPTKLPAIRGNMETPEATLKLEWVYGYRSFDTRNNVFMNDSNNVVYHTAAVGIVYNPKSHSQKFYFGHTDDIICLAMHPNNRIVATGQMGKRPSIHIWDSETLECLKVLDGFHSRGVCLLAFSNDGSRIASVGQDDNYSVAIYNWSSFKKAAGKTASVGLITAKGNTDALLDLDWSDDDSTLMVCGIKVVKFFNTDSMRVTKCVMGKIGSLIPYTCCTYHKGEAVVAGSDGRVIGFKGREMVKVIHDTKASIYGLYPQEQNLLIGDIKGNIIVHDGTKVVETISTSTTDSESCGIKALSFNQATNSIMIGTKGAEIYEYKAKKFIKHAEGHYYGETWGLAAHPTLPRVVTSGDDGVLRLWDYRSRKLVAKTKVGGLARAVSFDPRGSKIAVTLGGRLGGKEEGKCGDFLVLDAKTLKNLGSGKAGNQWIQDIKFSPDGKTIAIGSHDSKIYFFDATTYKQRGVMDKHSSYITHMDFTKDGNYLQSNCGAYELLYTDVAKCTQVTDGATKTRDSQWETWTCVLGWPVQGIWPKYADGTDINAVDRTSTGNILATSDDLGKVKLFNYPNVQAGSAFNSYGGHSSHVTNVKWSFNDEKLLSTGGNDKALFQWQPFGLGKVGLKSDIFAQEETASGDQCAFEFDFKLEDTKETKGDEFMAIKPWLGAIVAPSKPPTQDRSPPKVTFDLDWIYGIQAQSLKNSCQYVINEYGKMGNLAYPVASVGVVYDPGYHYQQFNRNIEGVNKGCTDDIISMAVTPDGKYVAIGELGKRPRIVVYDAVSMKSVSVIENSHQRGVAAMCFSDDGTILGTVGLDNDHMVKLIDWASGTIVFSSKGDTNSIVGIAAGPGCSFVTVGVKHIYYWTYSNGAFKKERGALGKVSTLQTFHCAAFTKTGSVVGCTDGNIIVFKGTTAQSVVKAHNGIVNVLNFDGINIYSGGKDGFLKKFSSSMKEITPSEKFPSGVQSISIKPGLPPLIVTEQSSVVQVLSAGKQVELFSGHYGVRGNSGEVWGCAINPVFNNAVTTGDDGEVRLYDLSSHKCYLKKKFDGLIRAVAFSPDGNQIAISFGGRLGGKEEGKLGDFMILESKTLNTVMSGNAGKSWIQEMKYSPNGKVLAIGSHDSSVYFYDVEKGYSFLYKMDKHSSYITHSDFTADGKYLQSTCGAYELLFTDTTTGKQVTNGASLLKDAEWASWTCILGWPVQGIWPACADGTDINAVDRSHDKKYLVSADDQGKVRLFNYPPVAQKSGNITLDGHSSHVTNVKWSNDDRYILSAGGNDRGIFQWSKM